MSTDKWRIVRFFTVMLTIIVGVPLGYIAFYQAVILAYFTFAIEIIFICVGENQKEIAHLRSQMQWYHGTVPEADDYIIEDNEVTNPDSNERIGLK